VKSTHELVAEYQILSRRERLELLRLEKPRQLMIQFLIEFQQPTKQRRISAKTLTQLVVHFERDWRSIDSFFDKIEELCMPVDKWCQLRAEAETMPDKQTKLWKETFDQTAAVRSEIMIRVADLVPRVRYSAVGHDASQAHDLDGVGYMGLIKAMENFDSSRGVPFEAYARSWIYNSMIQYLRKDHLVNPSEKVLRSFRAYENAVADLRAKLSREPFEDEIAEAMNISTEQLYSLLSIDTSTRSMDASISEDEDGTLHDILGEEESQPYDKMESKSLALSLQQHMSKLKDQELSIVLLRWFPLKQSELKGNPTTIEKALVDMQRIAFRRLYALSTAHQEEPTLEKETLATS